MAWNRNTDQTPTLDYATYMRGSLKDREIVRARSQSLDMRNSFEDRQAAQRNLRNWSDQE